LIFEATVRAKDFQGGTRKSKERRREYLARRYALFVGERDGRGCGKWEDEGTDEGLVRLTKTNAGYIYVIVH